MAINKINLLLALLSLNFYFSCAQPKHKINPEARKLNDSALSLVFHSRLTDSAIYKNAISLLNRAIKIDSDYYVAYHRRFTFQTQLKQYNAALGSTKQMLKLRPNDVTILALTGGAYERAGDKISAMLCYNKALSKYQNLLDTMSINNGNYSSIATGKAAILILLDKKALSDAYLKNIIQKETDPLNKEVYEEFLAFSRNDVLYGKAITTSENAKPIKY